MDLTELTLTQARARLLRGTLSAAEYAQALLQQMDRTRPLGAIVASDAAALMTQARAQDAAGLPRDAARPLAGIPLLLKDNINTAALPTSAGTPALRDRVPPSDAAAARRVFDAGALLAGKANMHELAFGITSHNAAFGPVRNPWRPDLIPGGSSGGSAAAVAARAVPASLGTDTGASVRLPAALCGVTGLRPTVGRYPGAGVVPISHTRDTVGPIARSVDDIVLLDGVLSGDDQPLAEVSLRELRMGLPRQCFEGADPGVAAVIEDAIRVLARAGVTFIEVDIAPLLEINAGVGFPVALYEVVRDLAAYLRDCGYALTVRDIVAEVASPDVAGILRSQLGADAIPALSYEQALVARTRLQSAYVQHFASQRLDALLFPTAVLPARPIGDDETVELCGVRVPTFATYIRNTDAGSNAAIPGISLPAGLTLEGLPVGLELDGPACSDRRLLAIARAVERELPLLPAPRGLRMPAPI